MTVGNYAKIIEALEIIKSHYKGEELEEIAEKIEIKVLEDNIPF